MIPGEIRPDPATLICLGVRWEYQGDDNENSLCTLHYRAVGEQEWRRGMDLMPYRGDIRQDLPRMFIGSVIDLESDTAYELRLHLEDPDGITGAAEQTLSLRTRAEPMAVPGGEVRHVYPPARRGEPPPYAKEDMLEPHYTSIWSALRGKQLGTHDGGKLDDGLKTIAPPGTTILVHAGTYRPDPDHYRDPYGLTFFGRQILSYSGTREQPICIKAAGDGEVIIDGAGEECVFDVQASNWLIFEGLTLQNAKIGILAGMWHTRGAQGIAVKRCIIRDVNSGIIAFHEDCREYYIADNTIIGRYPENLGRAGEWAGTSSMYGINLTGSGHVVCYNYVERFFDSIDIWTNRRTPAFDIYNNHIEWAADNAIEADGGSWNIRILRNLVVNGGSIPLSNQVPYPGPVYWIRNVVVNSGKAFKDLASHGQFKYHNTLMGWNSMISGLEHSAYLNNIFIAPAPWMLADDAGKGRPLTVTQIPVPSESATLAFDHNLYVVPETAPVPLAYAYQSGHGWSDDRVERSFDSLSALAGATGYESHGLVVSEPPFRTYALPPTDEFQRGGPLFRWQDQDWRLRPDSPAIDAGTVIPNVNDNFTGAAPDLGAYEQGQSSPHYGPRP